MSNNNEWYVINTYLGKENRVKKIIKKMNFDEVQVCSLNRIISEKKENVIKPKMKPIFPGYVFIKGNLDALKYISIMSLRNVIGFAGDGIIPMPVTEKHIIKLLDYAVNCAENAIADSLVAIRGEELHVIKGPLKGLENTISRTMLRRNRVYLDLSIFGNRHIVAMPVMNLGKEGSLS